ncbi:C6 transcription factor [Purpureocillium lavendulum]|uniref:C6 transcription factor n=1 Tax=Purpureocillium lavendulum TaxID=1247861 RepID=A0AB34FZ29_9HYPO|nr:C6 transcription factor [Purpureocillium lavendulum]
MSLTLDGDNGLLQLHEAELRHSNTPASAAAANAFLPPFISPVPQSWTRPDIEYLYQKGVFSLPDRKDLCALLRSYVEWVHPLCPLLDLHEFLAAIAHPDGSSGSVSLMVLHSVLLAGAAFVDERHLAGHDSRLSARKDYFTRAKLLYSMGYESDRLRIVQSLLLMSYWQELHDDAANHWYWAEVGCSVARSIGLYKDPTSAGMSDGDKALWKRVGWSCMLRDRVLNLGVRMPPKIRPSEFQLPMLEEADFGVEPFPSAVVDLLGGCELLANPQLHARLARMCIEKCKLCVLLGNVFDALYVDSSPKLGERTEVTLILLPRAADEDPESSSRVEQSLHSWLLNLPLEMQHQQPSEPFLSSETELSLVHSSLVLMFYQAIMCTVYRPRLLSSDDSASYDMTKQKMNYATLMITRQLECLQTHGLLRFMPSSCVTFLLTAAVNHLVEYKSSKGGDRTPQHLRRFRDCCWYLESLQAVHIYAKYAAIFLDGIAGQAGISPSHGPTVSRSSETGGHKHQDREPSDTEGLGPWAVAHTPDQLRHQPSAETSSTPTSRMTLPSADGAAMAMALQDGGTLARSGYLDGASSYHADTLAPSGQVEMQEFLSRTLWEHGWLDEVAEKWPEYLDYSQPFGPWQ